MQKVTGNFILINIIYLTVIVFIAVAIFAEILIERHIISCMLHK